MTISIREALLIAAALLVVVFFVLWQNASRTLDNERTKSARYLASATHNAERLAEVLDLHNQLVADLATESAAAAAAADRIDRLRDDLVTRLAENAALRAQLKTDRPDVQDYYAQPVPRPAVELLLHAAGEDRVP